MANTINLEGESTGDGVIAVADALLKLREGTRGEDVISNVDSWEGATGDDVISDDDL